MQETPLDQRKRAHPLRLTYCHKCILEARPLRKSAKLSTCLLKNSTRQRCKSRTRDLDPLIVGVAELLTIADS